MNGIRHDADEIDGTGTEGHKGHHGGRILRIFDGDWNTGGRENSFRVKQWNVPDTVDGGRVMRRMSPATAASGPIDMLLRRGRGLMTGIAG